MAEKPRILITCFSEIVGYDGISQRITDSIRGLVVDFKLDLMALRGSEQPYIEKFRGTRLFRVPYGDELFATVQAYRRALLRQIEGGDYLLCHAHDPFSGLVLAMEKERWSFKYIYELSTLPSWDIETTHPEFAANRKLVTQLRNEENYSIAHADAVIVHSEVARELALKKGADRNNINVITGGVDLGVYKPSSPPNDSVVKLLYLGDLSPWRDVETLVTALANLTTDVPFELTIIGPSLPEQRRSVIYHIRELGIREKVFLSEPVPPAEVPKVIADAHICLLSLTAHKRNVIGGYVPRVLFEYMAGGRAIVAAQTSAVAEVIEDGVSGMLYPPGKTRVLVDKLERLIGDARLRAEMGAKALARAQTSFAAEGVWFKLRSIYGKTIGVPAIDTSSRATPPIGVGDKDITLTGEIGRPPIGEQPDDVEPSETAQLPRDEPDEDDIPETVQIARPVPPKEAIAEADEGESYPSEYTPTASLVSLLKARRRRKQEHKAGPGAEAVEGGANSATDSPDTVPQTEPIRRDVDRRSERRGAEETTGAPATDGTEAEKAGGAAEEGQVPLGDRGTAVDDSDSYTPTAPIPVVEKPDTDGGGAGGTKGSGEGD